MKTPQELRATARNALRGKWCLATLVAFLAGLLGVDGFSLNLSSTTEQLNDFLSDYDLWDLLLPYLRTAGTVLLAVSILYFIIGGTIRLGLCIFNLLLIDGQKPAVSNLFSQFYRIWDGFCLSFLTQLYVTFWSLLFVIPGIIKSYSYALAPYLMAERPGMTARAALSASSDLMRGNKLRLFFLQLTFLGWILLCSVPLTLGVTVFCIAALSDALTLTWLFVPLIGALLSIVCALFLRPYQEATTAAFYRDLAGPYQAPQFDFFNTMH